MFVPIRRTFELRGRATPPLSTEWHGRFAVARTRARSGPEECKLAVASHPTTWAARLRRVIDDAHGALSSVAIRNPS